MGDRTSVRMQIGGALPREHVPAFLEAIQGDCVGVDWDTSEIGPDELEGMQGAPLSFTDSEANYGNLDQLEAFCAAHALHYRKQWDAGCGYPAGGEYFDGETSHEYSTTGTDGDPLFDVSDLDRYGSLDAVKAAVAKFTQPLPPFIIKGAPVLAPAEPAAVAATSRADLLAKIERLKDGAHSADEPLESEVADLLDEIADFLKGGA